MGAHLDMLLVSADMAIKHRSFLERAVPLYCMSSSHKGMQHDEFFVGSRLPMPAKAVEVMNDP